MRNPRAIAAIERHIVEDAPRILRPSFSVVETRAMRTGCDILLRCRGLDLRLEVMPLASEPRAFVRAAFRRRSPLGVSVPIARWTTLLTMSLPEKVTQADTSAMLARVRSELVGDPRTERLLAAAAKS